MPFVEELLDRVVAFIPVLLSLTVHEWAHAWTAWRLGDDTAKLLGRVSLNPIDHMDPVGTLLLPMLGIPFGWAKPVPVNPTRFHHGISMPMGMLLTVAAGPVSNLILALIGLVGMIGLTHIGDSPLAGGISSQALTTLTRFLQEVIAINVMLALFNLLPIPPLDGSQIVDALVSSSWRNSWAQAARLGPALLALIIVLPALFGISVFTWPLQWVNHLLDWAAVKNGQ